MLRFGHREDSGSWFGTHQGTYHEVLLLEEDDCAVIVSKLLLLPHLGPIDINCVVVAHLLSYYLALRAHAGLYRPAGEAKKWYGIPLRVISASPVGLAVV